MDATIQFDKFLEISLVLLGILSRAQGQYGGGRGTDDASYRIAAADLIAPGDHCLAKMTTSESNSLEWEGRPGARIAAANEADPGLIVIDDFESYTDEEGSRIYETWIDGWTNGTGSQVGYWTWGSPWPPVYSGYQSMPFDYNNAAPPYHSEAYRILDAPQDWTVGGVSDLSLWIKGRPIPTNSPNNLYLALQDHMGRIGVAVHSDRSVLNIEKWTQWRISMSTFTDAGVDLTAVKRVYIGVGDRQDPQANGTGRIWIDDIRVVRFTAVDANLVGWWPFDEGAGTVAHDYSGNICDGTIAGAAWAEGIHGVALDFAGGYVDIPAAAWATIDTQATVAFWAYTRPGASFVFGAFQDPAEGQARAMSAFMPGRYGYMYFETGGTTTDGYDRTYQVIDSAEYEKRWAHWAFIKNAETGEQQIYLNGSLWHRAIGLTRTMTGVTEFTIGRHPYLADCYLGMLDDFRLYDRALEAREIMLLAAPLEASDPWPADGATGVPPNQSLTLMWTAGQDAVKHHVYFGDSEELVSQGAAETDRGILTQTTFAPGELESLGTYYWRVDEIDADGSVRTGDVWRFATCLVLDDFESYNDDDNRIWNTWVDGWFNGTGSTIGYVNMWTRTIAYSGRESMPFEYNNVGPPYYSEASRAWYIPQDWTIYDTLTLHVHGRTDNDGDSLYVALEDAANRATTVIHPDPNAILTSAWSEWEIPLRDFTGVNLATVRRMYIGVGDRKNPQPGGWGQICIDDILLTRQKL